MKIDDRKWQFICKQLDELKKQSFAHDAAIDAVKLECHSPLVESFWSIQDALIASLSEIAGDASADINYFIFECDWGDKDMRVTTKSGESRLIKCYDDLRWLIEMD